MPHIDLLHGRFQDEEPSASGLGPKLQWFATGARPKGIIAIGVNAEGVIAIGVNAMGVVAIGVNALGTGVALGANAIAPLAISAVNSIAIVGVSLVNVIAGYGFGWVNQLVHPILGLLLLVASVWVSRKVGGRLVRPELPPLVPLSDLQAGTSERGWAKVALLGTERRAVVVGNSDGQVALVAPSKAVTYATELRDEGERQILAHIEVRRETLLATAGDYRAAAERARVLHVDELRRVPRRPLRPQDPGELRWVLAKSLWPCTALSATLMIALFFGWL